MSVPTQPNPNPGPPQGQPYPGQPGPPQGSYGFPPQPGYGYPAGTYGQLPPVADPTRPRQVTVAFWLLIGSAALAAIAVPVTLGYLNSPEYIEWLGRLTRRAGWEIDAVYLSAGMKFASVSILPWGIFDIAARVVLAFMARAGYNWARILVTIHSGFCLFGLLALFMTAPASGFLTLAALLASITAIVLLLGQRSNGYFARKKAYRRARKLSGYPS